MAEFMDYASSQCGKYYSSMPEEGGATHVFRYHRGKSELHLCADLYHDQIKVKEKPSLHSEGFSQTSELASASSHLTQAISKDLYIEVYPGVYSVTVGSNALNKKTHVVTVDSGQSVDLVFPV